MADEFLRSVSENGVVNEEKLSTEKIAELYGPLKEKIFESIKEQEGILNEVQVCIKVIICSNLIFRLGIRNFAPRKALVELNERIFSRNWLLLMMPILSLREI